MPEESYLNKTTTVNRLDMLWAIAKGIERVLNREDNLWYKDVLNRLTPEISLEIIKILFDEREDEN